MKRNIKLCILTLCSILPLAGCDQGTPSSSDSQSETVEALSEQDLATIANLKKGFLVKGSINTEVSYYSDSSYNIPATNKEKTEKEYILETHYQNSDKYTGIDRRYYKIYNGEERYVNGENAYDNNGKVGLNYVDYNNELQTDGYSSSDGYNEDSYGSSNLVNPFTLFKTSDFSKKNGKVYLNTTKTNILYTYLFAGLSKFLNMNVSFKEAEFSDDFGTVTIASYTHKGTAYEDYTSYYSLTNYSVSLTLSEIGTANAKDALQAEPVKDANNDLGNALSNMASASSVTISRHSITYDRGKKIDSEETVTTYNDGKNIYMQVYDYALYPNGPAEATASDLYLVPSSSTSLLGAYTLSAKNDDGTFNFTHNPSSYSTIDGYYYYGEFQPNFVMSQNIFNKNEDGSYSPTNDNLPYIGADCFVPPLNVTEEISGGYCSTMKIYLTEDKEYIDHINFIFDEDVYTGYTGEIIITYSNVGSTKTPFSINLK